MPWSSDGARIAQVARHTKQVTGVVTAGVVYEPAHDTWSPDGHTRCCTANVRTTSQLFRVSANGDIANRAHRHRRRGEPWDDPAQFAARSAMTFVTRQSHER